VFDVWSRAKIPHSRPRSAEPTFPSCCRTFYIVDTVAVRLVDTRLLTVGQSRRRVLLSVLHVCIRDLRPVIRAR